MEQETHTQQSTSNATIIVTDCDKNKINIQHPNYALESKSRTQEYVGSFEGDRAEWFIME